jgi:NTE family protein
VETDTSWAGLDVGVQFRNWGEIRVGARRGTFDGEVSTQSAFPDFDIDLGGWKVKATLDQLDNVFFPRRGSFVELNGFFSRDHVGADFDYDKVSLRTWNAWSVGHNTLVGGLEYGTDLGSDIPFFDEYELGGFLNLSGLTRGELQGDVKGLATLGYYWQLAELGALGRGFYVGAFAQGGNAWTDVEQIELGDLTYSGTVFAGLDTILAPVYLGWGLAEGGRDEFYLFIGRPFR